MLTNKTISYKSIIAKLYRDLQLKDEEGLIGDILEWTGEALDKIGVYNQFEEKSCIISVSNYKGNLPNDFSGLIQASHNNKIVNYSTSTRNIKTINSDYSYLTPYSYNQDK